MRNVFSVLILLFLSVAAIAQAGTLDPAFGDEGIVTILPDQKYSVGGTPRRIFVQPDGKLLLVLELSGRLLLTRHLESGALDTTFANKGFTKDFAFSNSYDAAIQPDGKVLLAGASGYSYPGAAVDFKIMRLNSDGSPDLTFGVGGTAFTDFGYEADVASAIVVQADGKIIVAGTAAHDLNKDGVFAAARYKANGQLDMTFNDDGMLTTDFGFRAQGAVAVLDQAGRLLIGGAVYKDGLFGDFALARYTALGLRDSTFGEGGQVVTDLNQTNDAAKSMAVDGDGRIIVAGTSSNVTYYSTQFGLVRYGGNGRLDSSFNGTGIINAAFRSDPFRPHAMVVQQDNKIVLNGTITNADPLFNFSILRFDTNGQPDASFFVAGQNLTSIPGYIRSTVTAIALRENGKSIATGVAANNNTANLSAVAIAQFDTDGFLDQSFGKNGITTSAYQQTLIIPDRPFALSDGKVLLAGWGIIDGESSPFFTKYNMDGTTDTTFAQNGTLAVRKTYSISSAVQTDDRILTSGFYYDSIGGIALTRFLPNGTLDSSYGNNGINLILPTPTGAAGFSAGPLFIQKTNKVVVPRSLVLFEPYTSSYFIERYNTNGSLDMSFGSGGRITADTNLLIRYKQKDDKFWVSDYSSLSTPNSTTIKRYTADGAIDSSFGQNGTLVLHFSIGTIAEQQNGDFIVSGYSGTAFNLQHALYRLHSNGQLDSAFSINGKAIPPPSWIVVQENDKIIMGSTRQTGSNSSEMTLTRYTADGIVDSTFGTNGTVATWIDPDGSNYSYGAVLANNRLYVYGGISNLSVTAFLAAYTIEEIPPSFECPSDKVVSTDKGVCFAKVNDIDPTGVSINSIAYKLTGATQGSGTGSVSGKTFNKGVTYVTYFLQSDSSQTCAFTVTVKDTEAPVLNRMTLSSIVVWPSNGNLNDITINYDALDNCGVADLTLSITDNAGNSVLNWDVINAHRLRLHTDQLQSICGKTFTATVTCTDLSGNTATKSLTFTMPACVVNNQNVQMLPLQIAALPNPSRNHFSVQIEGTNPAESVNVRVLNSASHVIEMHKVKANSVLQLGASYNPGIYYVEVEQGGKKVVTKLVKLSN